MYMLRFVKLGRLRSAAIGLAIGSLFSAQAGFSEDLPPIPRGVFNLVKAGGPIDPEALSNPAVDGISIRQKWRDLEPENGSYRWEYLDREIARAEKAGKAVLLRIADSGSNVPPWVLKKGVQTFTYKDRNPHHEEETGTAAIFWDPVYAGARKAMIAALGERFADNPAVKIVAANPAGARTNDWNIPKTPADIDNWKTAGFTPGKLIDAATEVIDTTMRSFPHQYVTIAVGRAGKLEPTQDYCARQIIEQVRKDYPGRLIVQKNNLSAKTASAPGGTSIFQIVWESRPDVAAQMLWFSYGDKTCRNNGHRSPCNPETTLRQSIATGAGYGMKYIEIYEQDVVHQPAVIRYAHELLTK